ncbi:hypothetical protein BXZ70DRAFT_916106 [Cristinia sonorae]|uniref:Uncharacterized protein n=1 Tax=Cristinia sonorae TaxID=1940300 RepID=A0A8K0XUH1_9AGAR|nr:hypothetical protein BXZ70DRAFT_916106 [Cristinia sonorae]
MNFTHDNLVLVAPRPVRLAAPTPYTHFTNAILHRPQARSAARLVSAPADAIDRLKLADDVADQLDAKHDPPSSSSDRDSASPRASPRAGLSSEALEEFLSILRPSTALLFRSASPVLRPANSNTSGSYFPYRRPASTRLSPSVTADGLLTDVPDIVDKENDGVGYPFKLWGSDHLGSPVARNLARNPFLRHPSYDEAVTSLFYSGATSPSPAPAAVTLSPSVVPLPPPTPDEELVSP